MEERERNERCWKIVCCYLWGWRKQRQARNVGTTVFCYCNKYNLRDEDIPVGSQFRGFTLQLAGSII